MRIVRGTPFLPLSLCISTYLYIVFNGILLINILENIYGLSIAILLLYSFFYVRQLKKTKRERKLTTFEFAMYLITQIAIVLWVGSFLLLRYGI